jgi:hypothetical protein
MVRVLFPAMVPGMSMVVLAAPAAAVVPIPGLINSGQVVGGGSVSVGTVQDANWFLNGTAQPWNSIVNGSFPQPPWLADNSVSRWMTPASNPAASFDPTTAGFYVYSLDFDLTGFLPGTASFSGRFAADNAVASITLNGNTVFQAGPGSFSGWTAFSANSGFVTGTNQLLFTVRNDAGSGNPTGLRVEFSNSSISAVPESASWAMLIAGFGLVGAVRRRRRAIAAC